jgi:hypothetical protein
MRTEILLDIQAQPDDSTCGPACLTSLYRYYGEKELSLKKVAEEITRVDSGGTLAELLGVHAIKRGYQVTIYTYHLQMFDPTWFADDGLAHSVDDMCSRLEQQLRAKPGDRRLRTSTKAFQEFLQLGGQLKMEDLSPALLRRYLKAGVPIITGLSSTYLYRMSREMSTSEVEDDIHGVPQGHFVMVVGYDSEAKDALIADPLDPNPPFHTAKYRLGMERLVNAVLLGILTYDANLLVIEPGPDHRKPPKPRGGKGKKTGVRTWKVR